MMAFPVLKIRKKTVSQNVRIIMAFQVSKILKNASQKDRIILAFPVKNLKKVRLNKSE